MSLLVDYLAANFGPFEQFSEADRQILREACSGRIRRLRPGETLIHEGQRPQCAYFIIDGWACRYNSTCDERRLITAILLPGDFCDMNVYLLSAMDHSIAAISPVTLIEIERKSCERMTASSAIRAAILRDLLINASIHRQWMQRLGQRSALRQLAHLFCELCVRQRGALSGCTSCAMPLRQIELSETLGITPEHINRVLQDLRRKGLIELRQRTLTIPDLPTLSRLAGFNPDYLHLQPKVLMAAVS